jgi:hypothetical protein
MHKPTFIPKGKWLHGPLVDIAKSRGGLALPEGEIKNVTILMRVAAVGPDVVRCKPGDFIVYRQCFHILLRDGTHTALVNDDDVWSTVEGLDPLMLTIEGEEREGERGPQMPRAVVS